MTLTPGLSRLLGALSLPLLLAACGSTTTSTTSATSSSSSAAACASGLSSQSVTAAPLGITPHAYAAADWLLPHVAGEVLVDGSTVSSQGLSAQAVSSVRLQTVSGSNFLRATTPSGETDISFAARLAAAGVTVQPNYVYKALATPNDPGYPGNGGVTISGAAYTQAYLTRIDAASAWSSLQSLCGSITIAKTAVLDTGVDSTHPDLTGRVLAGYDFGDSDSDASDNSSESGHGTGVAGIIAATGNNGVGLTGLGWTGQSLLPVKVFDSSGSATTTSLTSGLNYAVAQGAKVINMSLGIEGQNTDTALAKAIQAAASADVVLVASAGNTATDGVYYPASDSNVIAVGAVGDSNALACYSARPNSTSTRALDLVAPGGNAGSGTSNCYVFTGTQILALDTTANGSYTTEAGTSFSSPMVAGAAALIRSYRPSLTATQVRAVLTSSAQAVTGGKLLDVGAAVTLAGTY